MLQERVCMYMRACVCRVRVCFRRLYVSVRVWVCVHASLRKRVCRDLCDNAHRLHYTRDFLHLGLSESERDPILKYKVQARMRSGSPVHSNHTHNFLVYCSLWQKIPKGHEQPFPSRSAACQVAKAARRDVSLHRPCVA